MKPQSRTNGSIQIDHVDEQETLHHGAAMYKRFWSDSLSYLRCLLFTSVLTLQKLACSLSLVLLTSACSSMLPTANTDSTSFESFDAARTAIEALVPMQSKRSALEKNGFNPANLPTVSYTHLRAHE